MIIKELIEARWKAIICGLLALALHAVIRHLARAAAERRARTLQLATLGRFAAQMAHDFKNPLAALKGAAQFLKDEAKRGRKKPMVGFIAGRTAPPQGLFLDEVFY